MLVWLLARSSPSLNRGLLRIGQSCCELLGDILCRALSSFRPRHHRGVSAAECDAPEDLPLVRTIGSARRHAPGLDGRAAGRPQRSVSIVAVWMELQSKDNLNALEELFPLRLLKAEYQPSEGRQKSILVPGLQAHPRQKIRTDHLEAIAAGLVAPKH